MCYQARSYRALVGVLISLWLVGCTPPPAPGGSDQVDVNESSVATEPVAEPIYLNNCGNTASSEQTSERSQTVTIEGGGQIGVSANVLQASVEGKYIITKGISKSQKVVASPGTNMKFVLLWTEQVNEGTVSVRGQSGQATYRVTVPLSVEQASAENLGCPRAAADSTPILSAPSPSPEPLADAIIFSNPNCPIPSVTASTMVLFRVRWGATTTELVEENATHLTFNATLDGHSLGDIRQFRQPTTSYNSQTLYHCSGDMVQSWVHWDVPLGRLGVGAHTLTIDYLVDAPIFDGSDTYGPGSFGVKTITFDVTP